MIDVQATKPIQCEGCGFAFQFAAGGKCAVDCPACGGENTLTHCLCVSCAETVETLQEMAQSCSQNCGDVNTAESVDIKTVSNEIMRCRAKNCPRLKQSCNKNEHACDKQTCGGHSTLSNSVSESDFPSGSSKGFPSIFPKEYSEKKQRLILLTTVCLQLVVLFGAAVYLLLDYRKSAPTGRPPVQVSDKNDLPVSPIFPVTVTPPQQSATAQTKISTVSISGTISSQNESNSLAIPFSNDVTVSQADKTPTASITATATSAIPDMFKPEVPDLDAAEADIAKVDIAKIEVVKPEVSQSAMKPSYQPLGDFADNTHHKPIAVLPDRTASATVIPVTGSTSIPVTITVEDMDKTSEISVTQPQTLDSAKMLEKQAELIVSEPERSLKEILSTIKTFEQLGKSIPSAAYWVLGQAYASLSWGKMFLINSPPIESMTISSDSRWVLTQREDNSVWIWDINRNQNSRGGIQLDSGKVPFIKLVFSPDLRLVVGGRADGMILIWDTAQPDSPETPIPRQEKITGLRDLQISPDGCWLAAFSGPPQSSVANRNHRYIYSTANGNDSPFPIEDIFRNNGKYLLHSGEPFPPYQVVRLHSIFPAGGMESTRISNDIPFESLGKAVQLGSSFPLHKNIQVAYFSDYSSVEPKRLSPKTAITSEPAVTVSEPHSEPNTVWLWNLRQVHNGFIPPPILLRWHDEEIRLIQFSPDSAKLALGGKNATTIVYDLEENKSEMVPTIFRGHRLDITAIAFSPDGRWLATGSRDNTIHLWDLTDKNNNRNSGRTTHSKPLPNPVVLNGHLGWVSSLHFDRSGTRLFSGSYDKTIRIWTIDPKNIESASTRDPQVLQSSQGVVQELILSPDGKKLISLGGDGSLRLCNIDGTINDRHSMTFRNKMLPISNIALTPNNRWLIFSYTNQRNPDNSGVRLWPLNLDHLVQLVSE